MSDEPSLGDFLRSVFELAQRVGGWVDEHQHEIRAFQIVVGANEACERTLLYAPASPASVEISDAGDGGLSDDELKAKILALHQPGTPGFEALVEVLSLSPVLISRQREVREVVDSIREGRNYVAICGMLPLIEGSLAGAHGTWLKTPEDYPVEDRLDQPGQLTDDQESELIFKASAIKMVSASLPELWRSGRHTPGSVELEVRRHRALHGTAQGWDTADNAVQVLMLLAAVAEIAIPLLGRNSAVQNRVQRS